MIVTAILLTVLYAVDASTNTPDGRPTVMLATARADDPYYNKQEPDGRPTKYEDIISFHAEYAKVVMKSSDNVVVMCDRPSCKKLREKGLPCDILWETDVWGIWMRDLTRVSLPYQIGFKYINDYMPKKDSLYFQKEWDKAMASVGAQFDDRVPIISDGGNVVDNFIGLGVMGARVFKDNKATTPEAQAELKAKIEKATGYKITILPELKEDTTGHADGLVSFIDDYVLAYSKFGEDTVTLDDKNGRKAIEKALFNSKSLKDNQVAFIGLPYEYPRSKKSFRGVTSSCGTHVNSLLTLKNLFVPVFSQDKDNEKEGLTKDLDDRALKLIKDNTKKTVHRVPVAKRICEMGGSVRCLSYVLNGDNADKVVNNAINKAKC